MKKKYLLFMAAMLSCNAFAQEAKTGWKELDAFHQMVPKYLHTAVAGDVKPIKENSGKLLVAAKKWQSSKAPQGSDTPQYKSDLAELVKECSDLNAAITSNKPDTAIRMLADKAHQVFHHILAQTVIQH